MFLDKIIFLYKIIMSRFINGTLYFIITALKNEKNKQFILDLAKLDISFEKR